MARARWRKVYPSSGWTPFTIKVREDGRYQVGRLHGAGAHRLEGKSSGSVSVGRSEGANFGYRTGDLQNRGVEDILIACVDGLTGFPEGNKQHLSADRRCSCV
ncbi:hypothetical protein KCP69_10975 [Salmonella enterica subsp. enterica]|nr:hypothetical protein KCP69_10975 [Salmonella enterica subsp. enterica]